MGARVLRGRRRRARPLVLALLAGLALVPWPPPPASASCAAPSLRIEGAPEGVPSIRRGREITVTGRGFVEGCADGGGSAVLGCDDPEASPTPMTGVELQLVVGRISRRSIPLDSADAGTAAEDRLGRIRWTVTIPEGQTPGPAALFVEGPAGLGLTRTVRVVRDDPGL